MGDISDLFNTWGSSLKSRNFELGISDTKESIEQFLNSEDEMMPLVKKVLANYLDSIVEHPEEFFKEYLISRDKKIQELEEKIQKLENEINMTKALNATIKAYQSSMTFGGFDYETSGLASKSSDGMDDIPF